MPVRVQVVRMMRILELEKLRRDREWRTCYRRSSRAITFPSTLVQILLLSPAFRCTSSFPEKFASASLAIIFLKVSIKPGEDCLTRRRRLEDPTFCPILSECIQQLWVDGLVSDALDSEPIRSSRAMLRLTSVPAAPALFYIRFNKYFLLIFWQRVSGSSWPKTQHPSECVGGHRRASFYTTILGVTFSLN